MFKFFRRIRQQLLSENKFSKYLLYAIGEIILVVIGILIALQINNVNENKKSQSNFKLVIEQAYNDIDLEVQNLEYKRSLSQQSIGYIDKILSHSNSIPDSKLAYMLFYVDYGLDANDNTNFSTSLFNQNIDFIKNDEKQLKLAKEVSDYINWKRWTQQAKSELIAPVLLEAGIPVPEIIIGFTQFEDFAQIDTTFFSQQEKSLIRKLAQSDRIKTLLKTLKTNKQTIDQMDFENGARDGRSVLELIKQYHPNVLLLYDNVGIIGTAIDGHSYVDNKSVPMQRVDSNQNIWKIELELKKGTVKFRTRDSWNENWGGNAFPKGKAMFYWENIPIPEAGTYRVTLNLSEKTYSFIKQ